MRKTLEEMGHPQPRTPIQTDNSTAFEVVNKKDTAQTNKSNGNEIPLASMQRHTGTILILLDARIPKLGRLLDQAPQRPTSQRHEARISDQHTNCVCTERINQANACGNSSSLSS